MGIDKSHETQAPEQIPLEEDKVYTPLEDLQRAEGVGPFKRENITSGSLPRGIRYIGYFLIAGIVLMTLIGLIMNFFMH